MSRIVMAGGKSHKDRKAERQTEVRKREKNI